ncbi:DoxX family protein [Desulfoluna limicola]|jgi:uncharacterized membrane protein|uniref:DoxX family protein n=1 Tax=Desulfoluna limicola TaxID=2810562 RepID=UPI001F19BEEE|nr:MauE/DoxX family redox-associated membrane protein [Desulfoluna limicola]
MKKLSTILCVALGLFMIYAGVSHFLKPVFYLPFVPEFLPFREAIVILSGLLEIFLGVAVLLPRYRHLGALSIMALLVLFLPVHVADVIRDTPAIGSHGAALVRLPIQVLFIFWAWVASRYAPRTFPEPLHH